MLLLVMDGSSCCNCCDNLGVVSNMDDLTDDDRSALINLSKLFGCQYLETVCINVSNKEEFLNPSIGTFLNDEMGYFMKDHFLNSSTYSDIIFKVEGLLCCLDFCAVNVNVAFTCLQYYYCVIFCVHVLYSSTEVEYSPFRLPDYQN